MNEIIRLHAQLLVGEQLIHQHFDEHGEAPPGCHRAHDLSDATVEHRLALQAVQYHPRAHIDGGLTTRMLTQIGRVVEHDVWRRICRPAMKHKTWAFAHAKKAEFFWAEDQFQHTRG